ncbi:MULTISPECIES: helix-turn-helix domain-containing protein [unclassified Janthinobacterium]|uniref:helix-turn-helix domain-containing protein n=1 Tax=unclassified Janthinobacterium TaxID=2610881 RepID=UPI000347F508|nr:MULTISPECIES: AraC family transcriptional regulator [unclassified Janthinobacterium]MEC5162349.1 AraC-like DNA-binding protein/mannose-6-phosphate isomerase-like protein (cupin superfamily) [Janthinobacterium sp. CG_S6]
MPPKSAHHALQLEHERERDATQGFEPKGTFGFIRYLEHGFPSSLVRWHYHDEYELHLILESSGKVFVGDYIGQFAPGHLVLTGPRVPHNWVSIDTPEEGVELRDMVIQFAHAPLETLAGVIPEVKSILPLLHRALHGIEFFNISAQAHERFMRIRDSAGLPRFIEFLTLLGELARSSDYQLLSTIPMQSTDDDAALARISSAINFIVQNYASQFSMKELAQQLDMPERMFSRFFRSATGNSFTDFVNRLRVNKACELLMETERYVTNICYDAGFNNVANFNRRFLELKGMTPKAFRQQAQGRFGA